MNDNDSPDYQQLFREALDELEELKLDAIHVWQLLEDPAHEAAARILRDAANRATEAIARLEGHFPEELEPAF